MSFFFFLATRASLSRSSSAPAAFRFFLRFGLHAFLLQEVHEVLAHRLGKGPRRHMVVDLLLAQHPELLYMDRGSTSADLAVMRRIFAEVVGTFGSKFLACTFRHPPLHMGITGPEELGRHPMPLIIGGQSRCDLQDHGALCMAFVVTNAALHQLPRSKSVVEPFLTIDTPRQPHPAGGGVNSCPSAKQLRRVGGTYSRGSTT